MRKLDPPISKFVEIACESREAESAAVHRDSGTLLPDDSSGEVKSTRSVFLIFDRLDWNLCGRNPRNFQPTNDAMKILITAFPKRFRVFLIPALLAFLVAETTAATVTLAWNANPEPDIAGYRVYYGTVAAPFGNLVDVGSPTATIANLENGVTYTFAVTAYNTAGAESAFSQPISYTVGSSRVIPEAVLHNVSDRAFVQTGENVMIGGFIVDGIVGKKVALRALGPSLADAGVSEAMADPFLQIVDSSGAVVASNDNWNVPGQELDAFGLAPTDAREAALVITIQPGAYSAIVSGRGASTGVALFELYDLDAETGRVANVSTRSSDRGRRQSADRWFHHRGHDWDAGDHSCNWSVPDRERCRGCLARPPPGRLRQQRHAPGLE